MSTDRPRGLRRKSIAGVTAAALLGLTLSHPALAFDDPLDSTVAAAPVFGFGLSGSLDFDNLKISGFSQQRITGLRGSSHGSADDFFSVHNGTVTTRLPLATFGNNVTYPGIFYNGNGLQFHEHLADAAEGSEASQELLWPYFLIGAGLAGSLLILGTNNSDDDGQEEPVVEDPVPVEPPAEDPAPEPPAEEPPETTEPEVTAPETPEPTAPTL